MDVKYLKDGTAVKVEGQFLGQIAVRRLYECFDGDIGPSTEFSDSLELVDKVYDTAPTTKKSKDIAELQETLDKLGSQLLEKRQELDKLKKEGDEILAKSKVHPVLARILDFIEGRITYFVHENYSSVKVVPFEESLAYLDDNNRSGQKGRGPKKLLTLFGKTKGELEWNLSQYPDGSGWGGNTVHPFPSYTAACEYAAKVIRDKMDVALKEGNQLDELIKSAHTIGMVVPLAVQEAQWKKKQAALIAARDKADIVKADADNALEFHKYNRPHGPKTP